MEGDLSNKQSNGYASMDFDITTTSMFDETTQPTVKPSGGTSSRKGIVRKLGSKSKNASTSRTSGNKKRKIYIMKYNLNSINTLNNHKIPLSLFFDSCS